MKYIIALDDGHGMETPGKRTPKFSDGTFMHENEFNRATVALLDMGLRNCGFDTLLTAPDDADTTLFGRTKLANNQIKNKYLKPVDFFISVHANAADEGLTFSKPGGISTHIYAKGGEAEKAAKIIHPLLLQGTAMEDRGIQVSNLHVLRETTMPAILFELGFMTNEREAKLLLTGAYRLECANEILKGMCLYYNMPFKPISIEPVIDFKAKFECLMSDIKGLINKNS